ncbi:osteoclast-associated immunoglobulin-like receptor [Cygnus olor]|uniref:osteoclast-associated immunoglobulin-like receptor n=1 Tax=Cygnus olor TaxID=8869 RepID=UPI001ADE24C2|nr:osteoclast-associated immunoglobulin-like receptor [Cygnus olor]
MAPMVVAFVLSWWLVARSRAQHPRQPFLSLHPSNGVALGGNVTLRCHLPQPALWVLLCRNEVWILYQYSTGEQNTTEFFFGDVQREHAEKYQCQYKDKGTMKLSVLSDPVELVVTDASFPPPGTMLSPSGGVETGTNVTIQCWASHGATFLLHKDGCSPPSQRQDPQEQDMATFTLPGVTPADAGTYRCSYIPHGYPFLSSPLGDKVTLEVTPASGAPRGTEGGPRRTLVVAVRGGCAATAALVFSLGLFFLLIARRRRRSASPQGLGATELQVPPRGPWPQEDSERLTYADLRPPAPGPPRVLAAPQPPIIYAQVGAGGTH